MPERPPRILLLEDDQQFRELLREALQWEGYTVDEVGRGEDAVARARETTYDLVISDIRMDGMSGLDALEQVQQERPGIRTMVITGYSTEADSVRAVQLGVGDYLKKPFSLDDFIGAVSRQLQRVTEVRRENEQRDSTYKTLIWAVETLARPVDLAGGGSLVANGKLCRELAERLGLPSPALAQLVSLVLGTSRAQTEEDSGWVEHLPAEARAPGSEEARLASLVAGEEVEAPPEWRQALADLKAGHPPARRLPARQGLAALARALEAAGDPRARAAYDEVLANSPTAQDGAEACLGLARMALGTGQKEAALELTRRAFDAVLQLAPAAQAGLMLAAAPLLLELGARQELAGRLQALTELHRQSGLEALEAQSTLLQAAVLGSPAAALESCLTTLLAPGRSELLMRLAPLVLPYLLELPDPSSLSERAAGRLVREHPLRVARLSQAGVLTTRGRIAALRNLKGSGEELARSLLADPDPAVQKAAQEHLERAEPGSHQAVVRILTLGRFEVYRGETRLDQKAWKGQKTGYFLACLAANAGRPVPEELLLEEFWPGDPAKSRNSLYQATTMVRKALCPDQSAEYLVRTGGGLAFNPDPPQYLDLSELNRVLNGADSESVAALHAMLQVDCGAYLPACYMNWAVQLRQRLETRLTETLLRLAAFATAQKLPAEALECARRVLELDACCQEAAALAMKASLELNRPEQAIRLYESCRRTLRLELDLEPSLDLEKLQIQARMAM